jgi:F-type H+-transporting ATPase subunit delta
MAEAITLARPYAEAMFKITKESLAPSKEEIDLLDVIFRDKNLIEFLANPTISKEEAENFIWSLLPQNFNESLKKLICLLLENSKIAIFGEILSQYKVLRNQDNNIVDAAIDSAFELTDQQKKSKKDFNISYVINKDLIGGMKITIGDTVIDGTVLHKLDSLRVAVVKT